MQLILNFITFFIHISQIADRRIEKPSDVLKVGDKVQAKIIGIDFDKVATGPLKAEPDLDEPMVGEVRASLQGLVDDSFQWFVDVVAERRGIPRPETLALSDGRILTGRQALTDKLIDAIGGESEAIAWLTSDKGVKTDLPVIDYFPVPDNSWFPPGKWLGQAARSSLGLPAEGPIALDGLVSLWQAR